MEYEITIFKNGNTKAPGPEMFYLNDWDKEYTLYTYLFVIKGYGQTILIDTGCKEVERINKMLDRAFNGKISFEIPKNETIEAIIKNGKINPLSVDYVFISHLHHDHVGNVDLFPNAKVVLSKRGWEEYLKMNRPYYYDEILFPSEQIKFISSLKNNKRILVDNEKEIIPGIKAFWVGGHTPCCMAVEVSTAKGPVIFTSDVSFLIENAKDNRPIGLFYNLWECFEAYKKINERSGIIITSHDPSILDSLYKNARI